MSNATQTQTEPVLEIDERKTIGNEVHRLRLYRLPELSSRWADGIARRFELVYTWMDATTGGVKGQECQGATFKDFRACKRVGIFGHYNLF
tara:strand:+ start:167954 stop:168226 length:273 start_codon:yes stop_codon:yes gene_type:complete